MAGDEHTGTQADAVDKAGEQKDQAAGGTHRRQGVAAQKIAHDEGVHRVVQLLKQIAEENGDREDQHALGNAAFGQGDLSFEHPIHPHLIDRVTKSMVSCGETVVKWEAFSGEPRRVRPGRRRGSGRRWCPAGCRGSSRTKYPARRHPPPPWPGRPPGSGLPRGRSPGW